MKIKQKIRQGIFEAGIILLITIVCGLLFNHFYSKGISLISPKKAVTIVSTTDTSRADDFASDSGVPRLISLEEARALFTAKMAIFLDARKPEHYEYGRIPGARLLSWTGWEEPPKIPADLTPDQLIVIYCSDPGCEMAAELAFFLFEKGYTKLRIFEGGWDAWSVANLPTEKGANREKIN